MLKVKLLHLLLQFCIFMKLSCFFFTFNSLLPWYQTFNLFYISYPATVLYCYYHTLITLSIWTDRPEQTVDTKIRPHRMQHLIRVYTICHSSINRLYEGIVLDKYYKELRCPNIYGKYCIQYINSFFKKP